MLDASRSSPAERSRTDLPRLLMVGSALGGGGSETRLRLLAQNLFEGTVDVAVLNDAGSDVLRAGQTVHALGWTGARSYVRVLQNLRRAVRSRPYDAILSFGLYPNTVAWASVRGLRRRPALVMTEITRPDTESRLFFSRTRHLTSHAVRRVTYPGADLCAANSEDGVSEVVETYGVDRRLIRRLPNLVEPERLAALAADPIPAEPNSATVARLCMVSRLDPIKRLDTLLEAVAGLPPDLACEIDIVGDGPQRAQLGELSNRLGIAGRVHFHGWCKNPYPYMSRALATVLASSYEGFSNTVLESMALGIPVITSFCSTDARLMDENGAALGFPVGDAAALRDQICRLIREPGLRIALSGRGRQYAMRHTVPRAVPEYEALVRDAVALRSKAD